MRGVVFAAGLALTAPGVLAQTAAPPAVTASPTPADPFAAIKAGSETPAQYQARYRYANVVRINGVKNASSGSDWKPAGGAP